MATVYKTGVPVVKLPNGDIAVIFTPADAVLYSDGTPVNEKIDAIAHRPVGDRAIGNTVMHHTSVPLSEAYVWAEGQTLDLSGYPLLQQVYNGAATAVIPNLTSAYPNMRWAMKVR